MALIGCLPNVPSVRGTNMNTEQPQYMEHACPCLHWTLSSFHGSIQSNTVNALSSVTLSVVSLLPLMVDKLFTNEMGQYLLMAMNNTLVKVCSLCSTLLHIVQHTSLYSINFLQYLLCLSHYRSSRKSWRSSGISQQSPSGCRSGDVTTTSAATQYTVFTATG